jgi:hypothetical protein
MGFQVAWSEKTPGVTHVSFSGHLTKCGNPVIEATPVYDSKLEDVTCEECAAPAWEKEGEEWRYNKPDGESVGYIKSEWDSGWDDGQWVFSGEQFAATWHYAYKSLGGVLSSYVDRFLTLDEAKAAVENV